MKPLLILAGVVQALQVCALGAGGRPEAAVEHRQLSQDIVTWDNRSLFINGERLMIFSGEFHPFRLPVPSLWLDIFQKVKALGLNCVSFYVDWALVEGKPGNFTAEGVFDLKPFFDAAKKAGLYLLARPGPYINAEVSGGGFPGWVSRIRGTLRTSAPDYLAATDNYMSNIAKIISDAQITNGGPVILLQPENEYTGAASFLPFPDGAYMEYVIQQSKKAGIVVPIISNDASASGHNAPGTGEGEVDIYGHDHYPLGFDCGNPTVWPSGYLRTTYWSTHLQQSPSTPYSIVEFQAGSFDPWGGWGFEKCSELINHEFERVFYKNNYAAGVTILNLYMIYGGTNWGNLGHPNGYTSYDYGSVIKEDRTITREKYSELKLQATFIQSSPDYLTATPGTNTVNEYSDNGDITITPLLANDTTAASFFIVRHTNYANTASTSYRVTLPTSKGSISAPVTNQTLTLNGRDSKMMVTDYDVQGTKILYSTADIFTHQKTESGAILILYAGAGEYNELAIQGSRGAVNEIENGADYVLAGDNSTEFVTVGWTASPQRSILQIGDVQVYLLDRNSAYNYWVTSTGDDGSKVIINGPYLVRSASIADGALQISADFNKSTPIEIIGAPASVTKFTVNDREFTSEASASSLTANITLDEPRYDIPALTDLDWKYIDTLPEIQKDYDDSAWPVADQTATNNTYQRLNTPVSLYGSDYGFNAGILVYRGHFNATGWETSFSLWTQGGSGFAASIWLDDTLLSSFHGDGSSEYSQASYNISSSSPLAAGSAHVFTVVVDQMGHNELSIGEDDMKSPRGIVGWRLATSKATNTPVAWKLTGNLGGEDYRDRARGPLNEGGLFAERHGYHLPAPPVSDWASSSPFAGIPTPGVAFYAAPLTLDLPADAWDIPLSFAFTNDSSSSGGAYRAQLYVNGWQFGKYASDIGPQTAYPVPEGILDYRGTNWVALSVWALDEGGARVPGLELVAGTPVWTGREKVQVVGAPGWEDREGAY
ncbi:glycoside hydrolase superfamily [Biscogniauxia mediterranea]|nr:glycoside hydrolase superfamily [Biscogniauxia mediterranea]